MFELLVVLCIYSFEGYVLVLDVLDYYKVSGGVVGVFGYGLGRTLIFGFFIDGV